MDRWEIPFLNMICHVNSDNEQSITLVHGCVRIHLLQHLSKLYWIKRQHPSLKTTQHTKTKEPHNRILSLKSPDMFQTSNLTQGYSILSAKVRYTLRFSHAHWCYSGKTDSISFIQRKIEVSPRKRKKQTTSK